MGRVRKYLKCSDGRHLAWLGRSLGPVGLGGRCLLGLPLCVMRSDANMQKL